MARTKVSKNAKIDKATLSNYKVVEKPKKVALADSETVVNLLGDFGDGGEVSIGTNNSKLVTKLKAIKPASNVTQDGFHTFIFDLTSFNFSFLPKKKRKGRTISPEHKAKLIAGKAGK
ncbi:MAG: hypothetical protein EKK57_07815 [Proteobacteria bacterium]|nr:MAG: hypothetical protein EKK57_07815 [Pseudomonadota bacterium]